MSKENDKDATLVGFLFGVSVCLVALTMSIIVELFTYNSSDVTEGKKFELQDKIYKCEQVKDIGVKNERDI